MVSYITPKPRRRNAAGTIRRHTTTICRLTGKIRYRDQNQAHDALVACRRARSRADLLGLTSTRDETRFYACACSGWHLTSQPLPFAASNAEVA